MAFKATSVDTNGWKATRILKPLSQARGSLGPTTNLVQPKVSSKELIVITNMPFDSKKILIHAKLPKYP